MLKVLPMIVLLMVTTTSAFAQSDEIPVGVMPDNEFLWGIDVALDNFVYQLQSNPSEKSKIGLNIANERLLEIKAMLDKDDVFHATKSENEHSKILRDVENEIGVRQEKSSEEKFKDVTDLEIRLEIHKEKIEALKTKFSGMDNNPQSLRVIQNLDEHLERLDAKVEERKNVVETQLIQDSNTSSVEVSKKIRDIEDKTERDVRLELRSPKGN